MEQFSSRKLVVNNQQIGRPVGMSNELPVSVSVSLTSDSVTGNFRQFNRRQSKFKSIVRRDRTLALD